VERAPQTGSGGKAGTSQRKQPSVRIGVRRNYGKY